MLAWCACYLGNPVPKSWVAEHRQCQEKVPAFLVNDNFASMSPSIEDTGAAGMARMFQVFAQGAEEREAASLIKVAKRPKLVSQLEEFLQMRYKYQGLGRRLFFLAGKSKCFIVFVGRVVGVGRCAPPPP